MRISTIFMGSALLLSTCAAEAQEPARPRYRNNDMRIAGIVLTAVASAALVTSFAMIFAPNQHCSEFGCDQTISGLLFVLPASTVFAGIGIPLWVVGALPPKSTAKAQIPAWALPSVTAGPRSASLRWIF